MADLPVPEGLGDALKAARDEGGNLACSMAWQIASQFGAPRILVGYIADTLGVRIAPCQLGAF